MINKTSIKFSLWVSLTVYWFFTIMLLIALLRNTNGHLVYPLDDTYIHMAMAKHFVNDGIWGVAQNGFSSSTSSPLWTLLIAITYKFFGVNDWSPLILSLSFGSFIIYCCYRLLQKNTNSLRLLLLLLIIELVIPLPVMTLIGMEHILHSLLTLLLIYFAATYLTKAGFDFYSYTLMVALANLTTITRYEGVLLVFSITLLLFIKKRFLEGCLFTLTGLFSVTVYGFISFVNGWHFLPNSILLKGNTLSLTFEGISVFAGRMISNFYDSPHITTLLIACLISCLWLKNRIGHKEKILISLVTMMTFMHMQFASTGWFFRYEAYIVLISSVVLADLLNTYIFTQFYEIQNTSVYDYGITIALIFLFLMPLAARTNLALSKYPQAVINIYEQQYQVGLFLDKYYSGECVAAHDIGAIDYLANICILDLYGLANMDALRYKLSNSYNKNALNQLQTDHPVQIAIIYNSWFPGMIPDHWIEAGRWKISNNVVCGHEEVSFYAPSNSLKEDVKANLIDFSNALPTTVAQTVIYPAR